MTIAKNGHCFPNSASYKITEGGVDNYIPAFLIESSILKDEIETCIKVNMAKILTQANALPSVFSSPIQQNLSPQQTNQMPTSFTSEEVPF